jgi:uncharacterized surface protein with fasciclin (FAS1) repeats
MKKLVVLLFVAALGFSCGGDDETPAVVTPPVVTPPALKSIAEIVNGNKDFTYLQAALKKAPVIADLLSKPGTYTIFAPDDNAFKAAGYANVELLNDLSATFVSELLANHALGKIVKSTDLKTGYVNTLSPGPGSTDKVLVPLSMYVDLDTEKGRVILNGGAKVKTPNIEASNGIIHIIEGNILRPLSIVQAVKANPALDTLEKVVTSKTGDAFGDQSGVLDTLDKATFADPLTLLAPTNGAFVTATEVGAWANGATGAPISTVLTYHAAKGNNVASSLKNDAVITTLSTQKLTVIIDGSSVNFKDTTIKPGTVLKENIQCTNGVIHTLDKVLKPAL